MESLKSDHILYPVELETSRSDVLIFVGYSFVSFMFPINGFIIEPEFVKLQ